MTNENDNDQFTNNQLNKEKGRTDRLYCLFGYWSLSFYLVIGMWLLSSILTAQKRGQPRLE
jgi:hypothetical protein